VADVRDADVSLSYYYGDQLEFFEFFFFLSHTALVLIHRSIFRCPQVYIKEEKQHQGTTSQEKKVCA
jgi:hypothetical protein